MSVEPRAASPAPDAGADAPVELGGEPVRQFRVSGKLGCLFTLVAGLVCVGIAWLVLERKAASRFEAVAQLEKLRDDASKMPGTDALRAAGCGDAGVIEVAETMRLAQSLENARAAKERRYPIGVDLGTTSRTAVVCAIARSTEHPPKCEAIADAYRKAVDPKEAFAVAIMAGGDLACGLEVPADGQAPAAAPKLRLPPLFGDVAASNP